MFVVFQECVKINSSFESIGSIFQNSAKEKSLVLSREVKSKRRVKDMSHMVRYSNCTSFSNILIGIYPADPCVDQQTQMSVNIQYTAITLPSKHVEKEILT